MTLSSRVSLIPSNMPMSVIEIPSDAVVILIGPAGAGKSTFARRHFPPEAVISPDAYREDVGGDASDQQRNGEVFERVHQVVEERAAAGLLIVIDATNTRGPGRSELAWHAHRHRRPLIAIALVLPLDVCLAQNHRRPDPVPVAVIRRQAADLRHLETDLEVEGYTAVGILHSAEDLRTLELVIGGRVA